MHIVESLLIALRGLSANKMRSILTMLGIIIGVAAVIALMSVGNGFEATMQENLSELGTNLLFVLPGASEGGGGFRVEPLTIGDAEAIDNPVKFPDVVGVSPTYSSSRVAVTFKSNETTTTVTGVTEAYSDVNNTPVEYGRGISAEDVTLKTRVAVIGTSLAEELFEDFEYPIGQRIRIEGMAFEVVGILESKGGGSTGGFGQDEDNVALIPLTTAQTRVFAVGTVRGERQISRFTVQVASDDKMEDVATAIEQELRRRHNIGVGEDDDFSVVNQEDMLEMVSTLTDALTMFLGSIAGISLVVGGIGIMNIMLVSVTERTREIGIRKAVGAKRRDIMMQFLIEAMMLSLMGGLLGVLLGIGVSRAVGMVMTDINTVVTPDSVIMSTGFAAAVGLFFGIYPATRAARLNPIDALRYE